MGGPFCIDRVWAYGRKIHPYPALGFGGNLRNVDGWLMRPKAHKIALDMSTKQSYGSE
jgi:hypothetical protein